MKVVSPIKNYTYIGRFVPFNDECQLFNSAGGKWWLYYGKDEAGKDNVTGAFKNKSKAMDWYNNGGR